MNIDVKRFYMPGFTLKSTCPQCGVVAELDLSEHYLSYPNTGEQDFPMYHHNPHDEVGPYVHHEWKVRVRLVVRLEAVADCDVEER